MKNIIKTLQNAKLLLFIFLSSGFILLTILLLANQDLVFYPFFRFKNALPLLFFIIFTISSAILYLKLSFFLPNPLILLALSLSALLVVAGTIGWEKSYFVLVGGLIVILAGFKFTKKHMLIWFGLMGVYLLLGALYFGYMEIGILALHYFVFGMAMLNMFSSGPYVKMLTALSSLLIPGLIGLLALFFILPNIYIGDSSYHEILLTTPDGQTVKVVQIKRSAFIDQYLVLKVFQKRALGFYDEVGNFSVDNYNFTRYEPQDFTWNLIFENHYTLGINNTDYLVNVYLR